MKIKTILGFLILGSALSAAQFNVPESVEKELNKSARSMSGSERRQFINWQKQAYIQLDKIGAESGIPAAEFQRIKKRMYQMYGSNYRKQLQIVNEEIEDYKELVNRVNAAAASQVPDESTNNIAKEDLKKSLEASTVPQEILNIYIKNAEKLYPNNYVAQKKYIDSMIEVFPKIINWIKNNKNILD
ncbi:hypothetical protein [Fusobacterium sp.]|uniref:hypothetical protein n=1 Tax=Fusobacterium sp. TaxID=68766 RepID=UPI00396D0133